MGVSDTADHPLHPPHDVRFEVMRMRWLNLTFLHWQFEPEQVQAVLPSDLTVDTFDGAAWVGLVPFQMEVMLRTHWPPPPGSFLEAGGLWGTMPTETWQTAGGQQWICTR